jgi:hypothetical protein
MQLIKLLLQAIAMRLQVLRLRLKTHLLGKAIARQKAANAELRRIFAEMQQS